MIDLRQGDCLELLRAIPDKSVDLVITDPPYNIGHFGGGAFGNKHRAYRSEIQSLSFGISNDVLEELYRVMKKTNIYLWCNKDQLRQYIDFFTDKGCNLDLLAWHKTNPTPASNNVYLCDTEYILFFRAKGVPLNGNYHTKHKYYVTPTNTADKKLYHHPTIKPLNIIENLVINSSNEGDVVLDPFMGSGTCGVACKKLGRDFIGMEINPEYYAIAQKRIAEYSEQLTMPY